MRQKLFIHTIMTFSLHADLPGKLASFGQKVQSLSGKRSLRSSLVSCSPSWSLFTDKSHLSFYGLTTCSAENLTKKPKKKQKKKSTLKATKYADSVFHLQEQTQDFDGAEIEKVTPIQFVSLFWFMQLTLVYVSCPLSVMFLPLWAVIFVSRSNTTRRVAERSKGSESTCLKT